MQEMSVKVDNNAYELVITPNKRKRDYPPGVDKYLHVANKPSAFCDYGNNKENHFVYNNFMEVKSISEIFAQKKDVPNANVVAVAIMADNPYEVSRKPPKKKTRRDVDDGCFVNPALNLNGPEKVLNPFEVRREPPVKLDNHCFVNSGLNLRGAEREVRNPFEISRDTALAKEIQGIENPALNMQPTRTIGLPFTPTVGCRIDFKNIPLEALTPCTMLNTKLVFSPVIKAVETTPKRRELSVISEEAVDISKELDCYQLELENSMNEAKASKKRGNKNLMDIKRKSSFARRLAELPPPIEDEMAMEEINDSITSEIIQQINHSCNEHGDAGGSECPRSSTPKTPKEQCIAKFTMDKSIADNPDVVYEEVEEESQLEIIVEQAGAEVEFKNPAPFVRTYRRDIKKPVRKLENDAEDAPAAKESGPHEVFGNLRSSIRKSFRKMMNHGHKTKSAEDLAEKETVAEPASHGNFLNTLRQSLRRKKTAAVVPEASHEMSIIDYKERAHFKDNASETKNEAEAEEAGGLFGTRTTIRHSFRKSSRRIMRSVLNKNVEDYSFDK